MKSRLENILKVKQVAQTRPKLVIQNYQVSRYFSSNKRFQSSIVRRLMYEGNLFLKWNFLCGVRQKSVSRVRFGIMAGCPHPFRSSRCFFLYLYLSLSYRSSVDLSFCLRTREKERKQRRFILYLSANYINRWSGSIKCPIQCLTIKVKV